MPREGEGGCENLNVQWTPSLQYMGMNGFLSVINFKWSLRIIRRHVLMTASQAQGQIKADQGLIFQVNLYQATSVCLNRHLCMVFQGIYLIHKVINFKWLLPLRYCRIEPTTATAQRCSNFQPLTLLVFFVLKLCTLILSFDLS